jgi:hypothetical protein
MQIIFRWSTIPGQIGIWNYLFLRRQENRRTRKKTLEARERINKQLVRESNPGHSGERRVPPMLLCNFPIDVFKLFGLWSWFVEFDKRSTLIFAEGGKLEKNPQSKGENQQQTQLTSYNTVLLWFTKKYSIFIFTNKSCDEQYNNNLFAPYTVIQ